MSTDPNFLAISFNDFPNVVEAGHSVLEFGVYDPDTGALIGITIKLGSLPIMMLPVAPIPDGAVRFDADRPT